MTTITTGALVNQSEASAHIYGASTKKIVRKENGPASAALGSPFQQNHVEKVNHQVKH